VKRDRRLLWGLPSVLGLCACGFCGVVSALASQARGQVQLTAALLWGGWRQIHQAGTFYFG
jgi:hypothetical protein